jgi:AAA family ATP:ADP antiporter
VDIYPPDQATRLFGLVAAGGTAGAIAGPALTATLVGMTGVKWLLPLSAAMFAVALICIHQLLHNPPRGRDRPLQSAAALGGGMLAGFRMLLGSRYLQGICLLILLYSGASTFLYFTQAHIVAAEMADGAQRTRLFALIDLAVNVLTVGAQLFATNRIAARFGLSTTLALIPALLIAGFLILGFAPVLSVLVVVQVLRRAGNYAVMKPAREMLFTVLTPTQKYKAKNLVDTLVYRGGDAVSGWLYAGMRAIGLDTGAIALAAMPLCGLWLFTGLRLGTQFDQLRRDARVEFTAGPDHLLHSRKET